MMPSEEAVSAARNSRQLFKLEIARKSSIGLMYSSRELSSKTYLHLQLVIEKTEKEDVSLPTPDKKDK